MLKNRRKYFFSTLLFSLISEKYTDVQKGVLLLFADFENSKHEFRQESSFYYLTGITEPAVALAIYFDKNNEKQTKEILYLPDYGGEREKWVATSLSIGNEKQAEDLKVDEIKKMGDLQKGYCSSPKFAENKYSNLIFDIENFIDDKTKVFSLLDESGFRYFYQTQILNGICNALPNLKEKIIDVSSVVDEMRRIKSKKEIDSIYDAIQITNFAHEAVCSVIKPGNTENEVKAMIEAVYTKMGASCGFPSIVATGKNTTVLHYMCKNSTLKDGDLVLVDIGAEHKYYSADLTRTYPVSGKFSKRQVEVYEIVLQTQAYVENLAKPGMFLSNSAEPEKSLHHLAVKFLKQKGYDKYFVHGIGHYLGLDIHDVGDSKEPLMSGVVFTIEPGVYIPEENLGIRIEDDFVMTDDGAVCLSYELPKSIKEIEGLFK